jgi:hypothetical protein
LIQRPRAGENSIFDWMMPKISEKYLQDSLDWHWGRLIGL